MKVLVLEKETELRRLLVYLLRRHGLEATEEGPANPRTLLRRGEESYDAVLFNADQTPLRRKRATSEAARRESGMRLVAFHHKSDLAPVEQGDVDMTLTFPFSSTELLRAVVGLPLAFSGPRRTQRPRRPGDAPVESLPSDPPAALPADASEPDPTS